MAIFSAHFEKCAGTAISYTTLKNSHFRLSPNSSEPGERNEIALCIQQKASTAGTRPGKSAKLLSSVIAFRKRSKFGVSISVRL